MGIITRLRDRAPVGRLLLVAWVAAVLYLMVTGLLVDYLRWEQLAGWADGERRDWALGAVLLRQLLAAVIPAGMLILFVAVVYVPTLIFVASLFDRWAELRSMLRQEYAGTLTVVLAVLAVALLLTLVPMVTLARPEWGTGLPVLPVLMILLPVPTIVLLMVPTARALFNLRLPAALLVAVLPLGSLLVLPLLMRAATFVCASPLLLILLFFLLRDRIDDLLRDSRSRESFRRNLELATINPADASAHYNLGLLYQQRGDLTGAKQSFARAVEIDPRETDAHYQLGRLAREEKRLTDALAHFQEVLAQDQAHAHHEIWREVGQVYYAAGQFKDALDMFDRFRGARPADAEGHYWRGMVLERLDRRPEAITEMRECIEAVRTSPSYKYRTEKRWLALAEDFLRERA